MTVGVDAKRSPENVRQPCEKISLKYNEMRKDHKLKNFRPQKMIVKSHLLSSQKVLQDAESDPHATKFYSFKQGLTSRISSGSNHLTNSDRKSGMYSHNRTDSNPNLRFSSGSHQR